MQHCLAVLTHGCVRGGTVLSAAALMLGCTLPIAQAVSPAPSWPLPVSQLAVAPAGKPVTARADSLRALGYVEQEFTLQGQARTYTKAGDWGDDGRWPVAPTATPTPYKIRMLVRRPLSPAQFNGIVVVEWMNTVLGFDLDGIWSLTRDEITREGYAWVGVSNEEDSVKGLQGMDTSRYGAMRVPSNDVSYDVFSQAGTALRLRAQEMLGQTGPLKLLAGGYSQAAVFINTYINAIQPRDEVYNGFLLHGRAPFAFPVVWGRWGKFNPSIRADLKAPVMQVQSEMEVTVSWPLSKTMDTDKVRYWEVPGATHFAQHLQDDTHEVAPSSFGTQPAQCLKPINTLPLHTVDNAALHALKTWVVDGKAPSKAARIQRNALGFVKHDDHGNALGGLRLPQMDAPIATYAMYANFTTQGWTRRNIYACMAGGSTQPFDREELRKLYPTHEAYVQQFKAAADAAQAAGFLRPADHAAALQQAQQAQVP
jgi:hypothetical protein